MKFKNNKKNKWIIMLKAIMKFFVVTMISYIGVYILCIIGINLVMPIILDYVISIGISSISSLNACRAIIRIIFSLIPTVFLIKRQYKYKEMLDNISENDEIVKKHGKEIEIKIDKDYEIEKQRVVVDNIMARYETLSRGKQMELLNYIKGDRTIGCLDNRLDSLNNNGLSLLQDELEDVLFPDFTELENGGYVKKRDIRNIR